jgi:predicted aspartyl protease
MNGRDLLNRQMATLSVILATLTWSSSVRAQTGDMKEGMDVLLRQRHYLELEQALALRASVLPRLSLAYFRGVMANKINHIQESLQLLTPLVPTLLATNPIRAELALCTLADDYAKSFRYASAASFYARANRVAEQQQKASECGAGREASRWGCLSKAPAQTVTTAGAFTVHGNRDALGLFRVPITSGTYMGSWVIDTGASLSVVSRSVANKLGIETSAHSQTAEGEGGLPVSVHTGVIPLVRLGTALLQNVAVLVVEDKDLNFPKFNYRIEGCLGIPVLAALGKVTFYHDGRINFSPTEKATEEKARSHHNFFLEEFTPVIPADFGHRKQLFTLDTGAMGTVLSDEFYEEEVGIANATELVNLELSGAGGTLSVPAYEVFSLVVKFGPSCARVRDLEILTGTTGTVGRLDEFYGEIGESALSSFSSFTLDFQAMHFSVTGGYPGDCTDSDKSMSLVLQGKQIDPPHITLH